jgi:hypothetical protein
VASQPKEIQDRCILRGAVFYEIEQLKTANGGKLPRGALQWALNELDMSKTRFTELWKEQYVPYRNDYPDADPAEAFSPHSEEGGRPRGRDIPPEVTRAMQQLYKERGFTSVNYDGTENPSRLPVLAKGILSGVKTLFPDHADDIKLYDVYAAINDLWKREAANVHLARGNDGIVDANMPTRNSDVEGSDEQWQIDIRPLPGYVRYGDIICTVLAVVIADRGSGKIWAGRLIPGVKVQNGEETDEEVWSGDYKAQEIRDLIATAIWRAKRCCRVLYPDNGSQFKKVVLGPYMRYLASESCDGSQVYQPRLENRTANHPRGGGFIENVLGNVDGWMRKFYGHHDEQVENFRTFYRLVNQKVNQLPEFEPVAKDFQAHIKYLNKHHREQDDHLTREELWKQGPDKSLPMPPPLNLAVFAKQVKKDKRKVQRYGFDYDSKQWEFECDDNAFRAQWVNAALSPEKRDIIIIKIGRETIVLMNVSGDGRTYVRAVPKGKPRNTVQEDKALNREARQILEEANRADSEELDEMIRSQLAGGQLVIHPAGKKLIERSEAPRIDGSQFADPSAEGQQASSAPEGFDPFDGRDPLDIPLDEMFGPGGIIDSYFEYTPSGARLRSDLHNRGDGNGTHAPDRDAATKQDTPDDTSAAETPVPDAKDSTSTQEDANAASHESTPAETATPTAPSSDPKTTEQSKPKQQAGSKGTRKKSQPAPQPADIDDQDEEEEDEWADFTGF